jgi:prophage antirepressor-like protein
VKELSKNFNGQNFKIVIKNQKELFIAKNACAILDIQNVSQALADVPEGHKFTISLTYSEEIGRKRAHNVLCVDESGHYRLIFKSRKPEAEKFQEWVFSEVLPSIRKTGKYDIRDIREKSTENRNLVTGGWQRQGVSTPREYGGLTKAEYQELFGNSALKKADMDRSQIITLAALEAVEALKLDNLPPDTLGYRGCRESITETAGFLEAIKNQNLLKSDARQVTA